MSVQAARVVLFCAALVAVLALCVPAAEVGAEPGPEPADGLLSRIDFGNAYIMGQTIQSGAVYLLNRKRSEIRSMLDQRTDYRPEIFEDAEVLDPDRAALSATAGNP